MHQVIIDSLEDYLASAGDPYPGQREFETHLSQCPECRQQVQEIAEVSGLFVTLKSDGEFAPAPGFYFRLAERIGAERPFSLWSLFSLDPAFGRRVVFASLLMLAVFGSFLVSRESEYARGPVSPESVMALDQGAPAQDPAADRNMMLVTLTSYEP